MVLLPYNASTEAKYHWIGRPFPFADRVTQTPDYLALLASLCVEEGVETRIGS
jgi:hypothetical protein